MNSDGLLLTPLGGVEEVGLNCHVLAWGDSCIILDAGVIFPPDDRLGIDLMIPDFGPVVHGIRRVLGLFLSHGHEDHLGAVPFLLAKLDVPVFGSDLALGLIGEKLAERDIGREPDLRLFGAGDRVELGPFGVEAVAMRHSIPFSTALAVTTPAGVVIYTGDFKFDDSPGLGPRTDVDRLAQLGREGVLVLMSDSTNAESPGVSLSEAEVRGRLEDMIAGSGARVLVAVFSTHLDRIAALINMARAHGRRVLFLGRSIRSMVRLAEGLGIISLPRGMEVNPAEASLVPPGELLVITTGSQGEPLSALTRLAGGFHKKLSIEPGDTVILSARVIPGHELAVGRMIDKLLQRGARVIGPDRAHASGHGLADELRRMIRLCRPEYLVPVHGFYRHLRAHGDLAISDGMSPDRVFFLKNGDVVRFDRTGARIETGYAVGREYVDGFGVGDVGYTEIKARRRLGSEGVITVVAVVDELTGQTLAGPEIVTRGVLGRAAEGPVISEMVAVVDQVLKEVDGSPDSVDWAEVSDRIRRHTRRYCHKRLGRRPEVTPVLIPM